MIIEYKRALNENVINQGLFYLDWLLDHRAKFTLHCMKVLGAEVQDKFDWTAPRLVCIAGDFTKYDEHAVAQSNRNIELVRYRRYGDDLIVLELVNASSGTPLEATCTDPGPVKQRTFYEKTVSEYFTQSPADLRDLYQGFEDSPSPLVTTLRARR